MRLRNLFMILLLCMTVGVLGTSCTGDDGEAGPPGPQGPPGPAGPAGDDGDDGGGSVAHNYPFLVNWGKASGKMACDDPLLTETGMFPGPALKALPVATPEQRTALVTTSGTAIVAATADNANGYVEVACNADVFDHVNPDLNGDGTGNLVSPVGDADGPTLVFIKSHRDGDAAPVPQEGTKAAATGVAGVSITEQKNFTAGQFFADMDTRGGSDEAIQRAQLYHDCGVGTAPSALKGHWRAVNIVNVMRNTVLSTDGLEIPLAGSEVTKTTQKVCLRLDSLPGAVKCYVREQTTLPTVTIPAGSFADSAMASDTEKIIIYGDGSDPMVVMPHAAAATATVNPGKLNPTADTATTQFIADSLDFAGTKLCNLFTEAKPDPS